MRSIVSEDGELWFVAGDVCKVLDLPNVGQALARLDDDEKDSITIADGTPGSPVRAIVTEDGEPWFVGADVCRVLQHSNTAMALKGLDDDERGVSEVYTPGGPQQINTVNEFPVDARKLRAAFGNSADFSTWWAKRVSAYGFQPSRDYTVFQRPLENPAGGRPARDYLVTLEMAKHLAMVEKTTKGREARAYFTECEGRLRAVPTGINVGPITHLETAEALVESLKSNRRLQYQIEADAPKVDFHERVV